MRLFILFMSLMFAKFVFASHVVAEDNIKVKIEYKTPSNTVHSVAILEDHIIRFQNLIDRKSKGDLSIIYKEKLTAVPNKNKTALGGNRIRMLRCNKNNSSINI